MTHSSGLALALRLLPLVVFTFGGCGGKSDTTSQATGGRGGAQATGGGGQGGAQATGGNSTNVEVGGEGSFVSCTLKSDCTWTEIDLEILQTSDCMCLFGCPGTLVNTATAKRRSKQYEAKCTYGQDGNGDPCPIDDCIAPPAVTCDNGTCVSSP
jgi:hypothetical protein